MITQSQIQEIHATYCALTGLQVPLSMQRIYAWEMWCTEFKPPDLEIVVRHLKQKVRERPKLLRCFKFEWFIGNRENFAEDLAEARALMRAPKVNGERASVLRATGRVETMPDVVHTPAEFLASKEGLKKLIALRDTL